MPADQIHTRASADGLRAFMETALQWLTRVCGASFFVAVATFPIIKAEGDINLLLIGYAPVVLAVAIVLALVKLRALAPRALAASPLDGVPALVALFCLALVLRIGALLLLDIDPVGDPAGHEQTAWNVASGAGYVRQNGPDAHWPPGYVLFASMFYFIFGRDWHVLVMVNSVVDASTAVLVCLAARAFLARQQAWIAGLLYALNPTMILLSQVVLYTVLLAFLFCVALFIRRRTVLLGVHIGLMSLVKPIAVPLVAIFAVDRYLSGLGLRRAVVMAATLLAVAAATVSPWTIRNYLVFDRFLPVSANGGWVLWWGNNDSANGFMLDWSDDQKAAAGAGLIDLDRRLMHESLTWIAENKTRFLALIPIKQAYTWGTEVAALPDLREFGPVVEQAIRGIAQTWYLVLILLTGLAMTLQTRPLISRTEGRLICMMIMMMWVIHSVYIGWSAYRAFLLPFLSILAVVAVVAARRRAMPGRMETASDAQAVLTAPGG